MSIRGKLWVLVLSGAIAVYAVIGGLPYVGSVLNANAQQTANDSRSQMRIIDSVLQHIQNDYVDDPNMEKVRVGALRGLANGLDSYSAFLTADQVKEYQARLAKPKTSIGAEFSTVSGYLYVISAIKGGPADQAGMKSGDFIEYVDGKATRDISLYDAVQLVNGDPGTSVSLRVLRSAEKPQTIKVTRGTFAFPKSETRIEGGKIGVIKVFSLDEGSTADVRNQLSAFQKQGVGKVILDVRGVAGGKLDEAAGVANLFIKAGTLATVQGREGKLIRTLDADASKTIFTGEAAVLTNLSTAGAAEAIAAAFIDHKRGEVIGERTFGMGTEQQFFPMKSGDGYLLTVGKWASSTGKPFLGEERATMGVKPSIEVKRPDTPEPLDPESFIDQQNPVTPGATPVPTPTPKPKVPVSTEDIQMKKAIEVLSAKVDAAKAG